MVSIMSLWMPIVLAAVVVFFASFLLHMALGYHNSDFAKLPGEEAAMDALRSIQIPAGDYMMPHAGSNAERKDPAFIERMKRGPSAMMTVMPSGPPAMGALLGQWFVFSIVINVFAAYLTGRTLTSGASYLEVFRLVGTIVFMGYAVALWHDSIWFRRAWSTTIKYTVDGLIYGLLTGGVFGWLWPR